jgi:tail tube protein
MSNLSVPAIAAANTELYLGGPTSPPSYVLQGRVGDLKFNGVTVDMVDVSNQASPAHRMLGTLLKIGDLTFNLYWEPASTQDETLFTIILTTPPALQQWEVIWPDGTSWAFNGYLSKFTPDATITKALVAACTITVDNTISVTYGAGPT